MAARDPGRMRGDVKAMEQASQGCGSGVALAPLELGRGSKAGKSLVFIPARLSPDITNLSESLYIVPPTCPSVKEGIWLQSYSKHRCRKHGVISHQASLLQNSVCLPQGMYAVVSMDRCSFCPLIGSMRSEPARKPASAQDSRLKASCSS